MPDPPTPWRWLHYEREYVIHVRHEDAKGAAIVIRYVPEFEDDAVRHAITLCDELNENEQ